MQRVLHYMVKGYRRGNKMINRITLVVIFMLVLLFPAVFAAEYKQVQPMVIPQCYGDITFFVDGTTPTPFDSLDFTISDCPTTRSFRCPCGDGEKTFQFSVLDNISNTFSVAAQYYIAPHIEFSGNESQTYDPNSDNMRITRWAVKVEPTIAEPVEENTGTPVDSGKLLLLVFGIILVIGGGIVAVIKVLNKSEKKGEVKTKINTNKSQQPPKKVEETDDDVKKYLKELEEERRK